MAKKDTHQSPYTTFNGLTIRWSQKDGKHRVTIEGDNVKALYEGDNEAKASKAFNETVDHYKEREANQEQEKAEEKARMGL